MMKKEFSTTKDNEDQDEFWMHPKYAANAADFQVAAQVATCAANRCTGRKAALETSFHIHLQPARSCYAGRPIQAPNASPRVPSRPIFPLRCV